MNYTGKAMTDSGRELQIPEPQDINGLPEILSLPQIRARAAELVGALQLPESERTQLLNEFNELFLMAAGLDPLVESVANKQLFNHRLEQEVSRALRTDSPLSLLVLDLDNFKPVNDIAGHQAGDEVLRGVGRELRKTVRRTDTVGRLGGDEFAVILPDTSMLHCLVVAVRILETIPFLTPPSPPGKSIPQLAASMGLAQLAPNENPMALFERADKLGLLTAKNGGKNTVGLVISDSQYFSIKELNTSIRDDDKIDTINKGKIIERIIGSTILVHKNPL